MNRAHYKCKMSVGPDRWFVAQAYQSVNAIRSAAATHFGATVLDLIEEVMWPMQIIKTKLRKVA